jgi:molybdenum cofactor cytidylyltransferase/nicotine blue oxidoreductase
MTDVSGLVLAAGAGRRMGQPKADLYVGGERLIDRAVRVLRAGGCDEVVTVVREGVRCPDARVVVNPEPERGMGSSLRLALATATGLRAVILLVDTPGIGAPAVRAVLAADSPVVVATYHGRRGHPVAVDRSWWDEVAERAKGDRGARPFFAAHPELVREVECPGDPFDLDTAADLAMWRHDYSRVETCADGPT